MPLNKQMLGRSEGYSSTSRRHRRGPPRNCTDAQSAFLQLLYRKGDRTNRTVTDGAHRAFPYQTTLVTYYPILIISISFRAPRPRIAAVVLSALLVPTSRTANNIYSVVFT